MKLSDLGTVLVGSSSGLFIGNLLSASLTQNKGYDLFIMFIIGVNCWAIAGLKSYREWKTERKTKQ